MASSSTASTSVLDDLCAPFLPFDAASPVWSDVTPTPQAESSAPMCPILYNPDYSSAMDIYRALTTSNTSPSSLTTNELSPRGLALTSHLIQLNPSHFSVWQYRANIFLNSSTLLPQDVKVERDDLLRAELGWLDDLAHRNMKSYQVWQHRRLIVSELGEPGRELEFVKENLDKDAKNYHTWGYRQWVLAHFGGLSLALSPSSTSALAGSKGAGDYPELWDGEEAYVDQLLQEDVRNNSAWNHRWFVNFSRFGLTGSSSLPSSSLVGTEMIEKLQKKVGFEKAYTRSSLLNCPNNASAWTYLRALHTALPAPLSTPLNEALPWVKTLVSSNGEAERDASVDIMGRGSVGALEWWLDCIGESFTGEEGSAKVEGVGEAEMLVKRLCVADSVRKRFYAYRLKSIRRSILDRTTFVTA